MKFLGGAQSRDNSQDKQRSELTNEFNKRKRTLDQHLQKVIDKSKVAHMEINKRE